MVLLGLDATTWEEALQRVDPVMEAVRETAKPAWLQAYVTGEEAAFADMIEASEKDMLKAEVIGEPIALLILVLVFGSLVAGLIPLGTALVAISIALGIIMILGRAIWIPSIAQEFGVLMGLAVGIDYSLFIVSRYREELKRDKGLKEAVVESITHSGKAISFSGLCVIIGISALFVIGMATVNAMTLAVILVVAMTVITALLVLPAILSYLGPHIERPERLTRLIMRAHPGGGFWHRWAMTVMARPWLFFIGCVVVLGLLAAPTLRMRLWEPGAEQLSQGYLSRDGFDLLAEDFDLGVQTPVQIVMQFDHAILSEDGSVDPGAGAAIADLSERLRGMPEVSGVMSLTTLDPSDQMSYLAQLYQVLNVDSAQDTTVVYAYPAVNPTSADGLDMIPKIRQDLVPTVEGIGHPQQMLVGGATAMMYDMLDSLYSRFPLVIALILAFTFLALMILFRSVLIPLKAVLMNLMTVGATFGILVLVVQDGRLGFPASGAVIGDIPIMVFALLLGLSMDYEVFLLSRVRELHDRGAGDRESVALGLERTGGVITGAAAIMVVVFGAFMLADLAMMRELGFALAIAVLLDATIIRVVLVPATMRLMGKWNWWLPGWLDRILPEIVLEQDYATEGVGTEEEAVDTRPAIAD